MYRKYTVIMGIKERFKAYLKYKGISEGSFETKANLSNGYISNIGKSVGSEIQKKIKKHAADLSMDWLLHGDGDMIISNNTVNEAMTIYGPNDEEKGIPMYNAPGASGGVEIYTDANSDKIIGYLNFPGVTKGSFALPVYGHSMYPTLENGVWVVLRPIMNKMSINWGQIYYIEYDDYRVFKRLLAGDNDDDVILWSDNQMEVINDRPKYAQVIIKKTEIRRLCLVTDVYKKSNN